MPKFILSWEDLEFKHKPKDIKWLQYIIGGALVLILISLLLKNMLFVFLIILGAITLIMASMQQPKKITFGITKDGIVIDDKLIHFDTIEAFCIREEDTDEGEEYNLVLKLDKTLVPYVTIPLNNTDPEHVHKILSEKIHEEQLEKTLIEIFSEYIGFH